MISGAQDDEFAVRLSTPLIASRGNGGLADAPLHSQSFDVWEAAEGARVVARRLS